MQRGGGTTVATPPSRFRGSPLSPQSYPARGRRAAGSPVKQSQFYDGTSRTRSPQQRKPGWQYTVEAMQRWGQSAKQQLAQRRDGTIVNKRSRKLRYEINDGVRLISVESSEGNWDSPPAYPDDLVPPRDVPQRVRDADDFDVTLRDIFPWLAKLFQSCGCGFPREDRRVLYRPRPAPRPSGPRLETVCLDCGNVLENHLLPPDLLKTDRNTNYDFSRMVNCQGTFPKIRDKPPMYEGYKNWTVTASVAKKREQKFVALPNFENGPTRCFQNLPREVRPPAAETEYVIVDDSGVVALPDLGGSDNGR